MADLTIGEIGKVLQLNLVNLDQTVNPPQKTPLDLSTATAVSLLYAIANPNERPKAFVTKSMVINNAVNGVVKYVFQSGDLDKPPEMGKDGVFRYSVKVVFPTQTLYSNFDGQLTIKDDSVL